MNFFEHQDRARKRTTLLVILFVLAVLSLIALTNLAVLAVLFFMQGQGAQERIAFDTALVPWDLVLSVALAILLIVALASLYKLAQLSGGGRRVAEALGGRLLNTASQDSQERQLLNIVEEMAIASGTPVPPVYLIEEQGINAFAAGLSPRDAVIGVTRGCMQLLDRDELQGVVAHEFSHIFNGDMRLNIRLIGVLYGILVIGIIGTRLLRLVSRVGYRSRSGKNQTLPLLALGAGLSLIGYLGTFFGSLIKAAVSRQREYLADAAAVQFTRNPLGIGGALKKIGAHSAGSRLEHPDTAEFSHMFFSQALTPMFGGLLATHPPLQRRIQRIEPQWDGRYPALVPNVAPAASQSGAASEPASATAATIQASVAGLAMAASSSAAAHAWVDSAGHLDTQRIAQAHELLAAMPEELKQAAHEPYGARALVYVLLLDPDPHWRAQQWQLLAARLDPELLALVRRFDSDYCRDPEQRLTLLELALPALKQLSPAQYAQFRADLVALMQADQEVKLFEWALFRILILHLEPRRPASAAGQVSSLKLLGRAAGLLLSALANAAQSEAAAQAAFLAAKAYLGLPRMDYLPPRDYDVQDLSRAVVLLERLAPLQKPKLLKALCICALHDGKIEPVEAELIRALAESLDCPMPPLQRERLVAPLPNP